MRASLLGLLLGGLATAWAINPITIKGHKMFDANTKEQFFIKGVAYQPRNEGTGKNAVVDPLADAAACQRDAPLMKQLGLNVVRVYEVDPRKNHDACMKAFADAGLYLLLDIATPKFSINRKLPEYDVRLFSAYRATIDAFAGYPNTLAFIAGNEVTNDKTNTEASAFVKAVIRDTKQYIRHTKKRYIPVGYASNDDEFIRDAIKDYFNCGNEDEQTDFFGVNLYEWCGSSSFEKSGYADRTRDFSSYSKPVFLTEYGCNLVTPRPFTEVEALYSSQMTDVWSGGVVYEWTQENNRYGLVKIDTNTQHAEVLEDYNNLKSALTKASPKGVQMDAFNEQRQASSCPSKTDNWKAPLELPPTPSEKACQCMRDNLGCVTSDKALNTDSSTNGTNAIGKQMDALCGTIPCKDISSDMEKGAYGIYSFCAPQDKLSWLYHLYIHNDKNAKCDFDGYAQLAAPKRNDLSSCPTIAPNMEGPSGEFASVTSHLTPTLLVYTLLVAMLWHCL
ncbi:Glucanosyltransferase-domain-containing protein [Radiomyces spectabilis]|uniref:Glucanosyltransferase-domain-containing protein n=1 Tax=Radiomyces spectabilis TaxID=64574 RepID=UPI002220C073|nr:Glucanosyltransferase-domain-containing protein [Radiomyces spectabilis]KAI8376025.1 Glucanosyltransferase-domain-containing protein [Radiomyces spectabilis]